MKKFAFILFFFLNFSNINAQFFNSFGLKFSYGFVLPHHEEIRYLINGYVPEFNAQIAHQTDGSHYWEQIWNFPTIGFGLYYAKLPNKNIMGYATALYGFYNNYIFQIKNLASKYYLALGIADLSKHFDPKNNYLNIMNGSRFNIFANANVELNYKLKNLTLYTDLGLTHYSNGGSKMPNLGLNIIAPSIGIRYNAKINKITHKTQNTHLKNDIFLFFSLSYHGDDFSVSNKAHLITNFNLDYGKYISKKLRISIGLDFLYDDNAKNFLMQQRKYNFTKKDYISIGFHLGYSMIFGNVQASIQPIFFFYKKYNEGKLFERLGFRYVFAKNYIAGLSLVTYFFDAKYIEPALGIRF